MYLSVPKGFCRALLERKFWNGQRKDSLTGLPILYLLVSWARYFVCAPVHPRAVQVCVCVCVRVCAHTTSNAIPRTSTTFRILLMQSLSLLCSSLSRRCWRDSTLQRSVCFCIPRSGIISSQQHACFLSNVSSVARTRALMPARQALSN